MKLKTGICISMVGMTLTAVALGGEIMTPGKWIPVSSAVETQGLKRYGEGAILGSIHDGAYAVFGPLEFADGLVDRIEIQLAAPKTLGRIEVLLDTPAGQRVSGIGIQGTGGYDTYSVHQGHSEQLAGTHRLVLFFRGGRDLCNVKAFRFLKPGQAGSPGAITEGTAAATPTEITSELAAILAPNREAIEKNRTTRITLRTAPGAVVSVHQKKHAFEFGTAINRRAFIPNDRMGDADQEQYKKVLKANFNSVVHENAMKWYSNEKQRDQLTFADADAMLTWSEENGLYTRGHCVYWGRDNLVQQWLKELDDETLRSEIKQRANDYMKHFKDRVREHDVNNEMLHCHYYSKRLGGNLRKEMFEWCGQRDPKATLYVNDYGILTGGDTGRYAAQIDGFITSGMKVGGIGVQGHFGGSVNGPDVKGKLDLLATFGLPIKVTEFDANTKDEQAKAKAVATLYATAFAHPAVEGIYMWGFWKKSHWRPDAALWDADWSETPAAQCYRELVYNRWWTSFEGNADAEGVCDVRVFFGEHDLTVNGKTRRISITKETESLLFDCRMPGTGTDGQGRKGRDRQGIHGQARTDTDVQGRAGTDTDVQGRTRTDRDRQGREE